MAYSDVVLADSPLLYWRLGESSGTTAVDASGNGRNGTYSGASYTLGQASLLGDAGDTSVAFTGTGVASTSLAVNPSTYAVEAWYQTSNSGTTRTVAGRISGADVMGFIYCDSLNRALALVQTNTTNATLNSNFIVNDGEPHHIVLVFRAAGGGSPNAELWVDGVLRDAKIVNGVPLTGSFPFRAGNDDSGSLPARGSVDEVAYYGTALSPSQIGAHYAEGIYVPPPPPPEPRPTYDVKVGDRISRANIRIGGNWLSRESRFGELEVTWGTHGPEEATWEMALRAGERPPFMRRGAVVEIYDGPLMIWQGTLGEPDWSENNFAAIGSARQGESAQCLNSTGAVTSKPNTAIDQAIARGVVRWTRSADFGAADLAGPEGSSGVDDPDPGSLSDLLDLWADENSKQWRISDDGRLIQATDSEATPTWLILPGEAEFGVADDRLLDRVLLRYSDSASGRYRTASYPATTPAGGIERRASVVGKGPMTSTRATTIAQGIYNAAQAGRTGWANSIDLVAEQVITRGGQRARISAIRPGHTISLLGATDPRNMLGSTNVVIDKVVWRATERRVQISPVGKVADTLEDILTTYQAEGA